MSAHGETAEIADAVVVAAGASARMGGIDKLGRMIAGRPVLAWTLEAVAAAPEVGSIVVVTAPDRRDELADAAWLPAKVRSVVVGGSRRQDSVAAGVAALEALVPDASGERVLLVHDGARPVLSPALVRSIVDGARSHGAAIPVLPVAETVKRVEGDRVVETIDRSALGVAQTPQGMRREIWRRAERTVGAGTWTDEAAMLEACRIPVHVVPGDPANLKVTLPVDLSRATASLVGEGAGTVRHGIGQDGHPFGPGTPLVLGGIVIDGAPRLAGHSDGDVVLHAVADALLGAAALGDLGRLFPAGPETPVGIDSSTLLTTVVARVADAGWQPAGIDLTIIGARPRLGPRLDLIRTSVAELVGLRSDQVSVKASTGNLDGSEGAGRSISTLALVTIEARS